MVNSAWGGIMREPKMRNVQMMIVSMRREVMGVSRAYEGERRLKNKQEEGVNPSKRQRGIDV